MQPKILSVIAFSVLLVFIITLYLSVTPIQRITLGKPGSREIPVRLKIPKINVDARVESVGLTPLGAMGAPAGPVDAAWFNLGPRPGEIGASIIDGHFGWKDGIPAIFDNLSQLKKGDKIYVENEMGATVTFAVREVHTYGENENASVVFNTNDGKAHLNLITCEGVWSSNRESYSNRLVVFADKVVLYSQ